MIIHDAQLARLKELLTEAEYNPLLEAVKADDIEKFQDLLDGYIFSRFDGNQEPTKESDKLENIYFEIYNQN